MQFLLAILSLAACASAAVKVHSLTGYGYHERVGIPAASRIKAAEDAYFANQSPLSKIAGGSESNSHAYLGGLLISFKNHSSIGVCGSSLISNNRLVTAAHCWFDGLLQASRFVVVLGSEFLFSGGERIATSTIATHPGWNPITLQNDIAVIYLQNPVLLSSNIQVIALPSNRDETFDGEWAIATGYGKTTDDEIGVSLYTVVREVSLQVITVLQCQAVYGAFVQQTHVCTSGAGGVGICGGDTGGPLVVDREGEPVLIGVSSFVANSGCQQGFPSGFTRVTSFYDFVTLHL